MDPQWDLQREREAERRGEVYAMVTTLAKTMDEVRNSVRDIQTNVNQLTKDMVSRDELAQVKVQVQGLNKWMWMAIGAIALVIFLSQAVPRFMDLLGQP